MPASTLCDDLCRKTSACQGNEPLVCVRQCESNAANVSAIGCGSELQAFLECMNANIVCKDGDFDALHVAEACRAPSEVLTACENRDGGPPDAG